MLPLYASHQFRDSDLKSFREYFQHGQANVFLAVLHLRDMAAINSEAIRHLDLRHAMFQAQRPESLTEVGGDGCPSPKCYPPERL